MENFLVFSTGKGLHETQLLSSEEPLITMTAVKTLATNIARYCSYGSKDKQLHVELISDRIS